MRIHGALKKWNDARGFGFVALPQSGDEVFVHISAFSRDGVPPRVGEVVSFEIRTGRDGRKRAEAIQRPGVRMADSRPPEEHSGFAGWLGGAVFALAVMAGAGFAGYSFFMRGPVVDGASSVAQGVEPRTPSFRCDGRTLCSQMTSCEEAQYFLQHCPGAQMDGNGDGEPCERQWCTW